MYNIEKKLYHQINATPEEWILEAAEKKRLGEETYILSILLFIIWKLREYLKKLEKQRNMNTKSQQPLRYCLHKEISLNKEKPRKTDES